MASSGASYPPVTPHQGGLHEAGVKSAKKHLNRAMNGAVVTQEELLTAFAEIEAILNSRPLGYASKPNYSTQILTPGHFLVGNSLVVLPEPVEANLNIKISTHYEDLRNRINSFKRQWRSDYLSQMQTLSKWRKPFRNLEIGEVVLLKEMDAPPRSWPYGLIVDTYPDRQGHVREVDLLTNGSIRRRGITSLIPLVPLDEPLVHPRGNVNGDCPK